MPNVLKGLLSGMAGGQAANKARAEAERKAQKEERTYALALTDQSRLLRSAAETEFGKLQARVDSEDWDPIKTPLLLKDARTFDQVYGKALGRGSAESHFAKALNLHGKKESASIPAGVMGPGITIEHETPNPLAGFTSPLQKATHQQKIADFDQEKMLGGLQMNGMQFLKEFASDDQGIFDPNKVGLGMLNWEAKMMAMRDANGQPVYDTQDMMAVTQKMRENMKPIMDEMIINDPNSRQYMEAIEQRSKDTSKWVKDQFTKINEFNMAVFDDKSEQIRNVVEDHAQQLVMLGYDIPTIKTEILQRFTVGQKWVLPGGDGTGVSMNITPHQQALAAMPRDHLAEVQNIYDNGYMGEPVDSVRWEPVHNEDTGETLLSSQIEGVSIPVTGPTSSIIGMRPAAPVAGSGKEQTGAESAQPKPEQKKEKKKTIDVSVGAANQQVRDFFGKLAETDRKARGKTPEMRAKLAQEAAEASLLADARNIRSKK